MRFVNLNWFLTLFISIALYIICAYLYRNFKGSKAVIWIPAVIMFAVSLLFPMAYISKTLSQMPIYCSFRSVPFCEVLVSFSVPLFAFISISLNNIIEQIILKTCIRWAMLFSCLVFVSIPYIKPVIRPLNPLIFHDKYADGVCMQSTSSTCGPACLATILNQYDLKETELSVAEHSFSCGSGTENWYLARYARQRGLRYKFFLIKNINEVQTPAIIGVGVGRSGHFITVLQYENGLYTVGDPLIGLEELSEIELLQKYPFTGFVLSFINEE